MRFFLVLGLMASAVYADVSHLSNAGYNYGVGQSGTIHSTSGSGHDSYTGHSVGGSVGAPSGHAIHTSHTTTSSVGGDGAFNGYTTGGSVGGGYEQQTTYTTGGGHGSDGGHQTTYTTGGGHGSDGGHQNTYTTGGGHGSHGGHHSGGSVSHISHTSSLSGLSDDLSVDLSAYTEAPVHHVSHVHTHREEAPVQRELHKQFYTFEAPEEGVQEAEQLERMQSLLKQNIQVIFVKAPENKALEKAASALAKSAFDTRTAVYVLHKQSELSNLANELTALSDHTVHKPEVHFVKYRTEEDVAKAKETIHSLYEKLGGTSEHKQGGTAKLLNFASYAPGYGTGYTKRVYTEGVNTGPTYVPPQ